MGGKGKGGFSGRRGFGNGVAADLGSFFELKGEKTTRDPDEGPAEVEEGEQGRGSQGVSFKWGKNGSFGLRKTLWKTRAFERGSAAWVVRG